ncbi:hypothetical protein L2E82_40764 [Cichorium intybus]|uniref:Uncharacterized protein n=1 Tax=Cichorium intybus TaxID=13427 RepID=A0ACB9AMV1_CICIN|nr:hypothetical protein L2E82_40764 [Cichorium intybus]
MEFWVETDREFVCSQQGISKIENNLRTILDSKMDLISKMDLKIGESPSSQIRFEDGSENPSRSQGKQIDFLLSDF